MAKELEVRHGVTGEIRRFKEKLDCEKWLDGTKGYLVGVLETDPKQQPELRMSEGRVIAPKMAGPVSCPVCGRVAPRGYCAHCCRKCGL